MRSSRALLRVLGAARSAGAPWIAPVSPGALWAGAAALPCAASAAAAAADAAVARRPARGFAASAGSNDDEPVHAYDYEDRIL
jgi:hypothetical protein